MGRSVTIFKDTTNNIKAEQKASNISDNVAVLNANLKNQNLSNLNIISSQFGQIHEVNVVNPHRESSKWNKSPLFNMQSCDRFV
jgi:hypothetical protein